jgi:hypothetical protein
MNNVNKLFIHLFNCVNSFQYISLVVSTGDNKYDKTRRASVCSLDSGTSLSFLSSNGTRNSDNNNNNNSKTNKLILMPNSPLAARSTEV